MLIEEGIEILTNMEIMKRRMTKISPKEIVKKSEVTMVIGIGEIEMIMMTRETGKIELREGMIKIEIERRGIRRTQEGVELTGMTGIVIGIGGGIEKIEVKGIVIGREVVDIWMKGVIDIVTGMIEVGMTEIYVFIYVYIHIYIYIYIKIHIQTIEMIEEVERGLAMIGGEMTGEGTRGRAVEVQGILTERGVKIDGTLFRCLHPYFCIFKSTYLYMYLYD
jgi:hypothetical protein